AAGRRDPSSPAEPLAPPLVSGPALRRDGFTRREDMATPERRSGPAGGRTLGGIIVAVGLVRVFMSSFWAGRSLALVGRMFFGGDREGLRRQIRRVVLHEVAHHCGINDERLEEMGRY